MDFLPCLGFVLDFLFLADLKNQPIGLLCLRHILQFCRYSKVQEQFGFNPTS